MNQIYNTILLIYAINFPEHYRQHRLLELLQQLSYWYYILPLPCPLCLNIFQYAYWMNTLGNYLPAYVKYSVTILIEVWAVQQCHTLYNGEIKREMPNGPFPSYKICMWNHFNILHAHETTAIFVAKEANRFQLFLFLQSQVFRDDTIHKFFDKMDDFIFNYSLSNYSGCLVAKFLWKQIKDNHL